jgi:hypothetical protein
LFLEGLMALHRAGELTFFGDLAGLAHADTFAAWLAPLRKAEWVVYAKPPFGGPEAVLAYLSRYTHRVAISEITPLILREPCPDCGGPMRIIEIFRRRQQPRSRAPPRENAA